MTDAICDLPIDDRPRERLRRHGARPLSDAELIAILLGSGTRAKNAIELARELLNEGLQTLLGRDVRQLARTKGVGLAKASRISAAFELSRRLSTFPIAEPHLFDSQKAGCALLQSESQHAQEHLGAFFLDSRSRIIGQSEIFVGTINHAAVSTRDIVRRALEENATAVAIYHNHPSGNPTPSAEDVAFTMKVRESLKLVDIELHDHIVIGARQFCSMRLKGIL